MTKASRLGEALAHGLPVPPFIVIDATVADTRISAQLDTLLAASHLADVDTFSVRSSANVEDGEGLSFAGQFETFLSVKRADLLRAITACRLSATGDNITAYANGDHAAITMDVIVQEMVDADVSGIVFSANPNGMLNEAVLVVGAGAGTVVADDVVTTSYYYHLDENVYYYEQTNDSPLLNVDVVDEIIALLRQCMAEYGQYIDIEFAVKNGKVWLLQVRPITTITTDDLVVFDNHNIVESYPGISLPLTQSFVTAAYTNIFKRLLEQSLGRKSVRRYDQVLDQMVRAVNGRMYYQVSSWYTILELLPFRNKILKVWQEMVGVDVDSIRRDVRPRLRDRVKIITMMLTSTFTLPRGMKQLHKKFRKIERAFRHEELKSLRINQLMDLYDTLSSTILSRWSLTLSNDMYTFIYTALYKWRVGQDAVLRTGKELPSTQLIEAYAALAKQKSSSSAATFNESLRHYCEEFGDRVPGELKLETETFRQNTTLLVQQLDKHLEPDDSAPIESNVPVRQGFLARHFHRHAALGVYNRELSRLDRAKIFGMVREIMMRIGEIMKTDGDITETRDIFYLTLDELRTHKKGTVLTAIIAARKEQYVQLELIPAYSRLVFSRDTIVEKQVRAGTDYVWSDAVGSLYGTACSPGIVEGEALVVKRIDGHLNAKNKILVAETTDPGWVFLLTQAKGVIAERGSLLSHTAIVSRELHKPSVVGVSGATRRIKTGDRVRLNGSTGQVELLS